jgi:hypothetical protein
LLLDIPSFIAHWRKAHICTVQVLDALAPEDSLWAKAAAAFSFGDLFRHLAGLDRFMVAENVQGRPSHYPGPLWPHQTGTRRPIHRKS